LDWKSRIGYGEVWIRRGLDMAKLGYGEAWKLGHTEDVNTMPYSE